MARADPQPFMNMSCSHIQQNIQRPAQVLGDTRSMSEAQHQQYFGPAHTAKAESSRATQASHQCCLPEGFLIGRLLCCKA